MAGNFPDAPGHRMVLDKDGTQFYKVSVANVISQLTAGDISAMSDESDTTAYPSALTGFADGFGDSSLLVYFPELRDVVGFFLVIGNNSPIANIYSSPNTTNGLDGDWDLVTAGLVVGTNIHQVPTSPGFRDEIAAISAAGVRALKFTFTRTGSSATNINAIYTLHLYGDRVAGQNPNRLELWHPTLDEKIGPAYFDWGNVPRSSSQDKTFRVKNISPTLTANSVNLTFNALTDTTPSVPAQHTLSPDASTFTGSLNIGTLAPGAMSSVLTMRRITPSNATLGLWSARILAEAASWS